MIEDASTRAMWLTDTLEWTAVCLRAREHISWQEAIQRINERWLEVSGFGPPAIEVRALRGALISGQHSARPPSTSEMQVLSAKGIETTIPKQCGSALGQVIEAFVNANGVPVGQQKKEIVARIQQFARDRQMVVPSERTIRRHLHTR